MTPAPVFVGIDVSKSHLDVHVRPTGQAFRLPNTDDGIATLRARISPLAPAKVVAEATGQLEAPLRGLVICSHRSRGSVTRLRLAPPTLANDCRRSAAGGCRAREGCRQRTPATLILQP